MNVREAAGRLEVKPATVYALCAAGLLAHRRVGVGRGQLRIDEEDIREYLAETHVARRPPSPKNPGGGVRGNHALVEKDYFA